MTTSANVAEDLAALRAIAAEHNLPVQSVMWLAITRTIKSDGPRASVSDFYYAARRVDRSTPAFAQFKSELQELCEALGVKMIREGRVWYIMKPASPKRTTAALRSLGANRRRF
jgi:hypothetical protein